MRYVEQAANNKWVIKEDPLSLIDLLNAIHEQQCCGGVADEDRETTDAAAYDPAEEMVRMTGAEIREFSRIVTAMQQAGLELDNRLCRLRLRWSICNVQ